MPELPEVETVRRGLERQTRCFVIDRVEVHRHRAIASPATPAAFAAALSEAEVGAWQRRGKYLMGQLSRNGEDAADPDYIGNVHGNLLAPCSGVMG